jgi:hypothetical protein
MPASAPTLKQRAATKSITSRTDLSIVSQSKWSCDGIFTHCGYWPLYVLTHLRSDVTSLSHTVHGMWRYTITHWKENFMLAILSDSFFEVQDYGGQIVFHNWIFEAFYQPIWRYPSRLYIDLHKNTTYSVWHNLYLLLYFQTLHVSSNPVIIRCLLIKNLKLKVKMWNIARYQKWYKIYNI